MFGNKNIIKQTHSTTKDHRNPFLTKPKYNSETTPQQTNLEVYNLEAGRRVIRPMQFPLKIRPEKKERGKVYP
jgi:hypothetical protein